MPSKMTPFLLLLSAPFALSQNLGSWSPLIDFPLIPVAAYIVPEYPVSNNMLMFSAFGNTTFSGPRGLTQFASYNHATGVVAHRQVAETQHDMFCPAMSSLPDGRLVISGGSNAEKVSIYDPASNSFTRAPNMRIARGYQASATLSNGKVFTVGGSYSGARGGKDGEIYDPAANTWTLLPNAKVAPMLTTDHEGIWREDNHGWLFGWRDGSVFQAGPSKTMHWYRTSGTGNVTAAGTRDAANDAMCGVNVMYDVGKIFTAGGAQDYTDSPATTRAHAITIGNVGAQATVERLPDMSCARAFGNAVVLPDGKVLVNGGQKVARVFTDTDGCLTPELWDPATKKFTQVAPEQTARNYHSVSLLMADGTVFSGGGGMCYIPNDRNVNDRGNCDNSVDHLNGQFYSPPYLFNAQGQPATRPTINGVKSALDGINGYRVQVGGQLTVTVDGNATGVSFVLIRIGSVTHSTNSDQRRIPLTVASRNGAQVTMRLPNDAGVVIPGAYYFFALRNGVPSIARTVSVRL